MEGDGIMAKAPKLTKAQRENAERADLLDKEPTQLHIDMATWLVQKTGFEPSDFDEMVKIVQLTRVLLTVFQKSDINQQRLRESAQAREQADKERAAQAKNDSTASGNGRKRGKGTTATAEPAEEAPKGSRGRSRKGGVTTETAPAATGGAKGGRRGGRRTAAAAAATGGGDEVSNENPF